MNVYIVDDDEDIIDTLKYQIEDLGYEVVAFNSALPFMKVHADLPSGCVVLDYKMPVMDGLMVQKHLSEAKSAHAVILVTGFGDIPEAVAAMRAGAIDVLRKPFRQAELREALSRAEAKLTGLERFEALGHLSNRERQVLLGLAAGRTSKAIAEELGISTRTVDVHRASMLKKLRVPNTGAALVLAQQGGLLPNS